MRLDGAVRTTCGALLISAVACGGDAFACSCAQPGTPCAAFERTDAAIFVGTVIGVSPPAADSDATPALRFVSVRFSVVEAFRGMPGSTAVVSTPDNSGSCGYPFEPGESYLVYASRGADGLHTSVCSRTGRLSDTRDDLELLREAAVGAVRPRLHGTVIFLQSRLNGTLIPGIAGALPHVKVIASSGTATHEATTDDTGVFRFSGLEPGRYTVRPDVEAPLKAAFDPEVIVELDACSADADLLLTTESLTGTVRRHDGSPGPRDLKVTVVDVQRVSPARSAIAFTGVDGRWTIEGLPAGRYLVGVNAFQAPTAISPYPTLWYPGVTDPGHAQQIAFLDGRTRHLDLTLPAPLPLRTIRGVVLDAQGRAVAGASVSLSDREFPADEVGTAFTDAEGRFSIRAIAARRLRLRAQLHTRGGSVESDVTDVTDAVQDAALTLTLWRASSGPR